MAGRVGAGALSYPGDDISLLRSLSKQRQKNCIRQAFYHGICLQYGIRTEAGTFGVRPKDFGLIANRKKWMNLL
jgi:hypothetical protein